MIQAAIAAAGVGIAAYGLVKGRGDSKRVAQAQAAITAASIRAENLRRDQMRLESFRRQREFIRQGIVNRSLAVSSAANQGTMNSSGLYGGTAEIQGRTAQGVSSQSQNLSIGEGMFDANIQKMNAELALGSARSSQQFNNSLFQFGTSLAGNAAGISSNVQSIGSSLYSSSQSSNPYRASSGWNHTSTLYA
jgi:hypothetical protein